MAAVAAIATHARSMLPAAARRLPSAWQRLGGSPRFYNSGRPSMPIDPAMSAELARALQYAHPPRIIALGDDNDHLLRVKCVDVLPAEIRKGPFRCRLAEVHRALADFKVKHGFGRAIAAPQVGIAKRFIAMNTELGLLTIINPRVLWRSPETFLVWDDCFSVPRCMVRRRRPVSMSFCFLDDSGTHRVWEHCPRDVTELIEHEMDHLDGVLMSDYPEEPLETAFLKREQYLQDREKWDRELREFDKPSHPQQPRQRVMCI